MVLNEDIHEFDDKEERTLLEKVIEYIKNKLNKIFKSE